MAEKPDDKWTVPLCGGCHRTQHGQSEQEFWRAAQKDPIFISLALWANTGNHDAGLRIVQDTND